MPLGTRSARLSIDALMSHYASTSYTTVFGKTFSNVMNCVSEVLFDCCASYVSMLCKSGWLAVQTEWLAVGGASGSLYRLNGSLWVWG